MEDILEKLREQTIALVHKSPTRADVDFSNSTFKQILEELNNYHIELSAQNDELQIANQRLQSTTEIFNAMFYGAPIGYMLLDAKYKIIEINSKGLSIMHLKKSNYSNLRLINYIASGEVKKFLDWSVDKSAKTLEIKLMIEHEQKWISLDKAYWQDKKEFIFLTIQDITQVKENQIYEMQKKRIEALTLLLNNVSHHWRQPLTVISLILNTLQDKAKNNQIDTKYIDEKTTKGIDTIKKLSTVIDDFKSIFDLNSDDFKYFDIKDAINDAMQQTTNLYISLKIDKDIESSNIYGMSTKFTEVIFRVFESAIEEMGEDKKIEIDGKKYEDNYKISIRYDGVLKDENMLEIFDPYNSEKLTGKINLSPLYIAKIMVEYHMNGKLEVRNNNNFIEIKIILTLD